MLGYTGKWSVMHVVCTERGVTLYNAGSESDTTIQNSPVVPKKKRRRSLSARYKDYIT